MKPCRAAAWLKAVWGGKQKGSRQAVERETTARGCLPGPLAGSQLGCAGSERDGTFSVFFMEASSKGLRGAC